MLVCLQWKVHAISVHILVLIAADDLCSPAPRQMVTRRLAPTFQSALVNKTGEHVKYSWGRSDKCCTTEQPLWVRKYTHKLTMRWSHWRSSFSCDKCYQGQNTFSNLQLQLVQSLCEADFCPETRINDRGALSIFLPLTRVDHAIVTAHTQNGRHPTASMG